MDLNDMFRKSGIDPEKVLVLRNTPREPELYKVLPWLAAERPDLFKAYQQAHSSKLENAMESLSNVGYVASFIGQAAGKAMFVGLYRIGRFKRLSPDQYWNKPANKELEQFGMRGFRDDRPTTMWFDLIPVDFYKSWKGKLIVSWPPPERVWWRRAHRNNIPVLTILEESALAGAMPKWHMIDWSWEQLRALPTDWKAALRQWRGVYFIFDTAICKGYVGSAYGEENLLGRWQNYAKSGHGGNRLLKKRKPNKLKFSILELVSPTTDATTIIGLENSWKKRLHSRSPLGLNDN